MVFNIDAFLTCVCCGTIFLGLFFFISSCRYQGIKQLALLLVVGLLAALGGFIFYKLEETVAAVIIYVISFSGILGVFGGLFLMLNGVALDSDETKIPTVLVWIFYVLCIGLMVFSVSFGLNNM